MMKIYLPKLVLLASLFFLSNIAAAQNTDCATAEIICSDAQIGFNPTGSGINDFQPSGNNDGCLSGEHQSAWYYFEIQAGAPPGLPLGFTLTPNGGAGEDYDFAIFGPDVPCGALGSPIRCSFADASCGFCPETGLGMGATDVSEPPSGDGFVSMLPVNPGEGYYLLIDNWLSTSTGFDLDWTGPAAPWLNCTPACGAEAGTVNATPNPTCPGSTITFDVMGQNTDPAYTQLLLVVDATGSIVDIVMGTMGTLTSAICESYTIYSYNYETAGASVIPTIGSDISTLDCSVECCDLEPLVVSFEDTDLPTFPNGPIDETLSCIDLVMPMVDQEWNDLCDGMGMVPGVETGSADLCNGGVVTRTWEYTDACGNLGTHIQNITVDPAPVASFTNPPVDQTVTCENAPIPGTAPDLAYTNNALGACEISGFVPAVESGTTDLCGGVITYTWEFTDACNRTITHVQNITVDPAPIASFIAPPGDITIDCDDIPTAGPDLLYTNGVIGACEITGFVPAMESGTADVCGGVITYTWDFIDLCNRPISHSQNITVNPAPPAAFINPPADITVDCNTIPSGPGPDLFYTNNEIGSCEIMGSVPPVETSTADICGGTITYTWDFIDDCNRPITHTQNITIDPIPPAAFINPPADITVDCNAIPSGPGPDLFYTNNEIGSCEIMGSVPPMETGTADECGGMITYTWEFTDLCNRTITEVQNIVVNPAPAPVFLNTPADMTLSCDAAPLSAPDLTYSNSGIGDCLIEGMASPVQSGSFDECGGVVTFTWEAMSCGTPISYVQNITIDPAPQAAFVGPFPPDMTVDCENVPGLPGPLNYTNNLSGNCAIVGSAPATQSGSFNVCGGQRVFTWEFTDDCGRVITNQQIITVTPAPPAAFENPPGPITLSCSAVPASPPTLNYSNGVNGFCNISGTATAIQSGSYDACGGNITYTWVHTDICNRMISHSQVVTIDPASDPMFVNPPPDVTINCGEPYPNPINLPYTNGETGFCEISGSVPATVIVISPLQQEYQWTFTNPCNGFTILHTQLITQNPEPDIIVMPNQVTICEGQTFDLSTLSVVDQNGTNPMITFHSGSPAGPGNQLGSPIVSPTVSTTYYVLATNGFGCTDEEPFDVEIEELPDAGINGNGLVCYELSASVDLFSFLNGTPDLSGQWFDTYLYGVNVSDPYNVNLFGLPPGTYLFDYVVTSMGVCPDAMSTVTIELLPEMEIDILDIACTSDPDFYDVFFNGNGFTIVASGGGTLNDLGSGEYSITDIPIGNTINIIAINPLATDCISSISISPPDCNCPTVDPPLSNGNKTICEGEPNPELSVTVGPNETANWYTVPAGGTAFLTGSLTYTPSNPLPGLYEFYVEAENINDGCLSSLRTLITLEIVENPTGIDATLEECDTDQDGFVLFDLTQAETLISSNLGYTFQFFENMVDAQAGTNPLGTSYTNTSTPSQDLFVVIQNSDTCTAIVTLTLLVNLPPLITLDVMDETCLGDADGAITVSNPTGASYSLDSVTWTSNNVFDNLSSGTYTVYVENGDSCIASQNVDINPGMELILSTFDVSCDNNGTASDSTDDFYSISFTLNNTLNLAGTYSVHDGTTSQGSFSYGSPETFTVPANGQSFTLTFTDDTRTCSITQAVGPLNSCSTDCSISIDLLDISCSDNGTDTDPTDDFYTISINASAINGAANNTYNVLVAGVLSYNYTYGVTSMFTLPANGASPLITVADNADEQCTDSQSIGPLDPCSDACLLTGVISNIQCDNAGTGTDSSDDTYTFDLLVTGVNVSANWNGTPGGITGAYGVVENLGPYLISGGDQVLTIEDALDASCPIMLTAQAPATCSNDCEISFTTLDINCNDNATVSNQTDDFYEITIDASVINGGGTGNFEVFVGGVSYGIFAYGTGGMITIPADASSPTIEVRDEGEMTCVASQVIGPLDPCTDACTINATVSNIQCDDGGTNDPLDDTYTFDLLVTGQNTSATWEVSGGSTSDVYGTVVTLGPFLISAGDQVLNLEDSGNPACNTQVTALAPATCSPTCMITAVVSNIQCNDEATNDPLDDTYTFDVLVTGQNTSAGWQVAGGGTMGTYGTIVSFGPFLISGGDQVLDLEDIGNVACITQVTAQAPASCSPMCIISITNLDVNCDDNGTVSNQTDDTYEVSINASVISGGSTGNFEVWVDGTYFATFAYGTGGVITLPADGSSPSIEVRDETESTCLTSQPIGPLDPCTDACTISGTISNIQCNDEGTNDPTDDTYTFDLLVSGQNTSATWEVSGGGAPAAYGTVVTFGPFLISNGDQILDLQDSGNAACNTQVTALAPASCSPTCIISITNLDVNCNDNGTVSNQTDDTYEVTINASVISGGATGNFEVLVGGVSFGTFIYGTGGVITLPADGSSPIIEVRDETEITCITSQMIGPLDPCTSACTINATISNVQCNDEGTNDPSDDTYTFDVLVNGQNTTATWMTSGGVIGTYGTTTSFGPFLISGGDQILDISDSGNAACSTQVTAVAPTPCSLSCTITAALSNVQCDDGGTNDPSDDTYTFDVLVTGQNTGATWMTSGGITGTYGTITTAGPFLISGGDQILDIVDAADASCTTQVIAQAPATCSPTCTITAVISNVQCNDEGTNDPSDDTYTFEVLVTGQNTGTTWMTSGGITGTYGTITTAGPFLISDGDQTLDIVDAADAVCTTQVIAPAPATCSPTCSISIATLNFLCNDNGTVSQQNDDYYEVQIDATVSNGGSTNNFEVFVNSVSQGLFVYGVGGTFNVPADGSSPTIEIRDETEIACTDSQVIGPLDPCTGDCVLQATVINVLCDDNGTGNDSSDDTYTFELLVVGQNTSGQWQLEGGGLSGDFGNLVLAGPYLISDGNQILTIEDVVNTDCEIEVTAMAPTACSSCLQTVDAGSGFTLTCADTTALLQATSSEPGIYEWTLGGGFVSNDLAVSVEASGNYLFTATYPDGCVATDNVVVGLDVTPPMVNAGPDGFLTCDTTEITLDGTMSSLGIDYVYEWTNDLLVVLGTEPELLVNTAGTYFLQVTDTTNGCSSNVEEVIVLDSTASPLALILADPGVILDCVVGSIVLYTNPEPNIEYTWTQLGGSVVAAEITITEPGVIVLTATNTITGCESTDQIVVTDLEDYPIINVETPNFISCYDSQIVIDATNSQSGPDIIYNWYTGLNVLIPGENGDTLAVDQGGVYILQLLDTLNGCENFDTIMVESFLEVPLSQAAEDVYLPCEETATDLNIDLLSNINDLDIVWTTTDGDILSNGTTPTPSVNGTGAYYVSVQNRISGCILEDSLEVFNNPDVPRIALVDIASEKCLGASNGNIVVKGIDGGQAPYQYVLNSQAATPSGIFTPLSPGTYDLEITDANGCQLDTFFVIEPGVDLELSLPAVIELLQGQAGLVEAMVNVPPEDLQIIQWNPGDQLSCDTCLTTTILALDPESYVLSIVHKNGCLATASIQLFIRPELEVYIPNGFSPNGDGANDGFTLYANERVKEIERMLIFDRWGEEIFQANNIEPNLPQFGWDGSLHGEFMNPAVFVYVFEVLLEDGSREIFSGDVTLVR